jgi:hypothetical protein
MRVLSAFLALLVIPGAVRADQPDQARPCCNNCGQQCCSAAEKAEPASVEQQASPMGMSAEEHGNIFDLLSGHAAITRTVGEVPGGVKTITTTHDPELVETLREHVRQMTRRLEAGRPVRQWDPVFRDVFAHSESIRLEVVDIEGGVEVTETSDDPKAVEAIRAHAKKVNAFVAGGHPAARPPWAGGGRGRGAGPGFGPGTQPHDHETKGAEEPR